MGALFDFELAMLTALRADSTLVGLLGSSKHIADWPKQDGPYPWVTIGEDGEGQWLNKDESNYITDAVIHVWSRKRSWKEAKQIVDQIDVILLEGQLQLDVSSDFTIIGKGQRPEAAKHLPGDDEGKIRHIVVTYKFWLSC